MHAKSQNMLYPKEDTVAKRTSGERKLIYICRTCDNQEDVRDPSFPVYRNVVVHTAECVEVLSIMPFGNLYRTV